MTNTAPDQIDFTKSTLPNITLSLSGSDKEQLEQLGAMLQVYLRTFGCIFDLSSLDGVTVAADYDAALASIDRGRDGLRPLTRSTKDVAGVAMTPSVLRNGRLKSHLVFDLGIVVGLLLPPEHDDHERAVHVVAHECAHVTITAAYDNCFPDTLLRRQASTRADQIAGVGWQAWQEYAATKRAAVFGRDPTADYEGVFLDALAATCDDVQQCIDIYRQSHDIDVLYRDAFRLIERLMEITAYHVGNLAGRGCALEDRASYTTHIAHHPLAPHLIALATRCAAADESYGQWNNQEPFEAIGATLDDIAQSLGLIVVPLANGGIYLSVP